MSFYRRNLPHWHPEGKSIFITWRLYGSLPASVLRKMRTGRNACATNTAESENSPGKQFLQLDAALDSAKHGPLWLASPEFAAYAEYPIVHGAELGRYQLHAYVIMPNHVHILLDPYVPLAKISGPLKGVAACDINARLGRTGKPLWQDESVDHLIRNPAEFERLAHFIQRHPALPGLPTPPQDWKGPRAGSEYFAYVRRTGFSTPPGARGLMN